jgi:hypothetical protein
MVFDLFTNGKSYSIPLAIFSILRLQQSYYSTQNSALIADLRSTAIDQYNLHLQGW